MIMPLKAVQRRITGNQRRPHDHGSAADPRYDSAAIAATRSSRCCASAATSRAGKADDFTILDTRQIADTLAQHHRHPDRRARRRRRRQPAGRRHRHHEHHAGVGDRAHPRDRHPAGHRRAWPRRAAAVPGRGGGAVAARRPDRHGRSALSPRRSWRAPLRMPFVFDPQINLLAFVFSALIGVVFGYFPARARRRARSDRGAAARIDIFSKGTPASAAG